MTSGNGKSPMTSMERVLTALRHKEPDRVPLSLMLTIHGARELDLSIREYFSRPEYVVEGQLRMLKKYRHDFVNPFCAIAMAMEAFGGEVIWFEDGTPNSGEPIIRTEKDILALQVPKIEDTCLVQMLHIIQSLKEKVGDEVPIIGGIVSPFSLPVMQMGFSSYIELMHEQPELFQRLMKVNQEFCVDWANAQIQAGASFVCYYDGLISPAITAGAHLETGFRIARDTLARINGGPAGIHMAAAATLPVIEKVIAAGAVMIGVSILDDLVDLKAACRDRLTILGNLNGIKMRRWTPEQAEKNVKEAIATAAPGGGFILADNGEIPWQVSEETLMAISDAVHKWGRYPVCR